MSAFHRKERSITVAKQYRNEGSDLKKKEKGKKK